MSGKELSTYVTNSNYDVISQKQKFFMLQNDHNKGGSSSNRFHRQAEESEHNALKLACEFIEQLILDNKTESVFVCGIDAWAKDILDLFKTKTHLYPKFFSKGLIC